MYEGMRKLVTLTWDVARPLLENDDPAGWAMVVVVDCDCPGEMILFFLYGINLVSR